MPKIIPRDSLHYSPQLLADIGISQLSSTSCEGQIKCIPEDFIVQEIGLDGTLACNTPEAFEAPSPSRVYSAVVTKTNVSTTEAIHAIAAAIGCSPGQIGVAGKKDVRAITSQFVSLHGIKHEQLINCPSLPPSVHLSQISSSKQIVRTGDLRGNRFTIKVKACQPFDKNLIEHRLDELQHKGFPNYFGPQRFGPRFNNHIIGSLLLKGDYQEAGKALLTHTTPYESTTSLEIRSQAEEAWGDWKALIRLFESHPHSYRSELFLLSHLSSGKPVIDYWKKVSPLARFYANSYGSYIFNQALSSLKANGESFPSYIPTLSETERSIRFYQDTLHLDITPYFKGLSTVSKGLNRPWDIKSTVQPTIISYSVTSEEAVLCFNLPKGSYATIFLCHLFDLYDTLR